MEVRAIFCDISKAFDRVWHKGLLIKLESVGISGRLLRWFCDYLENRKQRVVLPGASSKWATITVGVPQGSILVPLLFLIYINDIVIDIKVVIITNLEQKQKSAQNAENITDLPKTLQVPSLCCFS